MGSPHIFRKDSSKNIKTIAHNTNRRRPRFQKKSKAVFISIRYRKTSQTQVVKSQSTERSVRKLAQPKRDSAFEQETRFVRKRETSESSQSIFFSNNQRIKPRRAQKNIFGTYSTSFWNVCVFFLVKSPNFFRKVWTKIIKTIAHNTNRQRPRFRKKSKAVFISLQYRKTSQTQDLKSQSTERSVRKLAQPKHDSAFGQETRIVSSGEIWRSFQNSFFSYNQSNMPTRAQRNIFGMYTTSFWKVSVLLMEKELFL